MKFSAQLFQRVRPIGNARRKSILRSRAWLLGTPIVLGGCIGSYWYKDDVRFMSSAVVRSARAASSALQIAGAYNLAFIRNSFDGDESSKDERISKCNSWCANRLYNLACRNGGVYVKLGQHIGALSYVLPEEYIAAMTPLQDQCPPSTIASIDELFVKDIGLHLNEVFEYFDPEPLGVASLAQVHRAVFSSGDKSPVAKPLRGKEAAVKVQHTKVADYALVDIATCSTLVKFIKWVFPSFEFEWVADELRRGLPKELDFVIEAENARRVSSMFSNNRYISVPQIFWAEKRILAMEFMDGARLDDKSFIVKNRLNPHRISEELNRAWNTMIFKEGFVHCDPHAGNILVRRVGSNWSRWIFKQDFELVLLDHGLYKELSRGFRLAYAHLWTALISGNPASIEAATQEVFRNGTVARRPKSSAVSLPDYKLFASVITGRPWDIIAGTDPKKAAREGSKVLTTVATDSTATLGIATLRQSNEMARLRQIANKPLFFVRLAGLLASVPRELLLLLKTNDLLRALDVSLGVSLSLSSNDPLAPRRNELHVLKSISHMSHFCNRVILEEEAMNALQLPFFSKLYTLCRCMFQFAYLEFFNQLFRLFITYKRFKLYLASPVRGSYVTTV